MGFMASTSIDVKIVRASLGASTEKSEGTVEIRLSLLTAEGATGTAGLLTAEGATGTAGLDMGSGASAFFKNRNPPPTKNATITKTMINPLLLPDLTSGAGVGT